MQQDVSHTEPATPPRRVTADELGLGPLFRASRDAVIVGGPNNRIIGWNPAAEHMFGYTESEAIDQPISMLVPDEYRPQVAELAQAVAIAMASDDPFLIDPIEIPTFHKSGREMIVEFSVSVMEVDGQPYGFATIRDCTERKRLESERDALLANAQETVRRAEELALLKADLASLIAHELGNPLGAMSAVLDLLDRDDLTPEQRKTLRGSLRGEVMLLQRLVEDIRAAASMESGEFSHRLEPTDLDAMLTEATMACQPLLMHHELVIDPIQGSRVLADRERISQVMRNLLTNAAKYTPHGTRVQVRTTQLDGRVRIEVEDNGPGIAPEDLDHIFTKFGRGRDATGQRIPGRGLGLYLSRQIVIQHGGDLIATSEPGTRTTFCFELQEAS